MISFPLEAHEEHELIAKSFHGLQVIQVDRFAQRVHRKARIAASSPCAPATKKFKSRFFAPTWPGGHPTIPPVVPRDLESPLFGRTDQKYGSGALGFVAPSEPFDRKNSR